MLFTRYSSFLSLSAVCLVYCCCTLAIVEAEAQAAQWQTEGQAMASEASSDNQPPPSSNDQAPPSSNGQAPPPSSNGQAPPPSSNGQAPPPSSNGQAPPPSSNGQAPPPSSNGQVPALNGQSASPPLPSNQVNPTHVGPPPPPPPQPPTSTGANRVPPPPPPRQQPPPAPPPRQPRRVPSFLVPSAESSNEFDGTEASFVYVLPSRGRQCFHHRSAKAFEFSFRVLHGGRLDVDVYVVGPGGKVAYESRERRQGQFSAPAAPPSAAPASPTDLPVHTVCLDNRHSSWYEKVIDFGIRRLDDRRLKNASASEELESVQLEKLPEELSAELQRLDLRWSTFLSLTLAVEDNLHRSASLQRDSRGDETQDRLAMEDSAARVSRWSALQLVVMLAVSVIQVLMIRSLFDEKSVLHRVWRARSGAFLIGS